MAQDKKLYDIRGLVVDEIEPDKYVRLIKRATNSKLKGNFYANQGGKVYYKDTKTGDNGNEEPDIPMIPIEPGNEIVDKSDLIEKKEEAEELNPDDYIDWSDVQEAIDNADKVIKDDDATQEEVDDALKKPEDALDNLEKKQISNG